MSEPGGLLLSQRCLIPSHQPTWAPCSRQYWGRKILIFLSFIIFIFFFILFIYFPIIFLKKKKKFGPEGVGVKMLCVYITYTYIHAYVFSRTVRVFTGGQ